MDRKIAKKLKKFNHNVAYYEKNVKDKEEFLEAGFNLSINQSSISL